MTPVMPLRTARRNLSVLEKRIIEYMDEARTARILDHHDVSTDREHWVNIGLEQWLRITDMIKTNQMERWFK